MKRFLILLMFLPMFGYGQIKVSEMTSATSVGDADIFMLIQGGSSKKVAFSVFDYGESDVATQIGDSLTLYRVEVADQIQDSIDAIPTGTVISLGTDGQIPYINSGGTDFDYSSNIAWNGVNLNLNTGTRNIFIGEGTGIATTGLNNIFIGYQSGSDNLSGGSNVFFGNFTGQSNTTGTSNSFIGYSSGNLNTTGLQNTFNGFNSGRSNTTGSNNSFYGYQSGVGAVSGGKNSFFGAESAFNNLTGSNNVVNGYQSGYLGSGYTGCVFMGYQSGYSNVGDNNIYIGRESGYSGALTSLNTYIGYKSGYSNLTGGENVFSGAYAGYSNTTGGRNTYIGNYSGYNSTGAGNVFLGYQAGQNETGSNKLLISNSATDSLIYGEFDNDILHLNADVTIDGDVFADNLIPISATQYQIPYVSVSGSGFDFSSNFTWNDTTLNLISGNGNVFIGQESGNVNTGNFNTFIGTTSGRLGEANYNNTFIGNQSGYNTTTGWDNCFLGSGAGRGNTTNNQNTYIGSNSGFASTGAGNIFLGYNSGYNETGSNKLYIENSNSSAPLIYGEFDNNYVQINDSLEVTKSITLGENEGENYKVGKLYYDTTKQALTFFNDINDFTHELGYEHVVRFYNNTGGTLTNGTVVRSIGSKVNGAVTFTADMAGNGSLDSLQGIAMVTADVLTGEFGVATLVGQVNGLNTSAFSDNDLLWVGNMGTYVNTSPTPPEYSAIFARVVYADADSGAIYIFPIGETGYRPTPGTSISFSRESETITNPGITIPELITNATNDLYTQDYSVGFTYAGDTLSPTQDGVYAISGDFAFQGDASTGDEWRVGIFLNGVEQFSVLRTSSSSNKGVISVSKLLSISTGEWISVRVENTTSGTRDSIFTDGVINVEFISSQ